MAKQNGERISHFNGGGKTFFFNKRKAVNKTEYLVLNAMYGNPPTYEKLVLFPQHLLEFSKHLDEAIEGLMGFTKPCRCGSVREDNPDKEAQSG